MKWNGWIWVSVAGCLAVATAAQAVGDNPYQKIIERNVFGLKPVPPPPPPPPPPEPPVPKITLQGITSILGYRQVLFKALAAPSPGMPPRDKSYMLSEGQREDDIEVLDISLSEGLVKFKNHGTEQILSMKTDSAKAAAGAALTPTKAPIPVPVFQNAAGGSKGEAPDSGLRRIPQRQVRTDPAEDAEAPQTSAGGAASAAAAPETPAFTPEQEPIIIELNRDEIERKIQTGEIPADKIPPPYPPTEFTQPNTRGVDYPANEITPPTSN